MLASSLIIAFILILFLVYGWAVVYLLRKWFTIPPTPHIRFSLILMTGMCTLTWIAQGFSLIMPLSLGAFLSILLGGIGAGFFLIRSHEFTIGLPKQYKALGLILFFLVVLSILENSTHLPVNPDTGIYHAQAIRWIETFPAVPGLGNLHSRFAYNSSWLVLNALFSFSFFGRQSFHLVPAALTLIAALDFTAGALAWLRGQGTLANILRTIFLPLTFFILGSQISSPGTDLPVILSLWLLLTAWLDQSTEEGAAQCLASVVIFIIAVTLLTIKLSAAPILILATWIWLQYLRKPLILAKMAGIAVVILLPWLARNVVLSGYLIYPFPVIDWLRVDWKIPVESVTNEIQVIKAWGRDPGAPVQEVLTKPFKSWLRLWFIEKTTNQKIILLGASSSILILGTGLLILRKVNNKFVQNYLPLITGYAVAAIGGIYWLQTSPDIRFGYGFLLAILGMSVTPWIIVIEQIFIQWRKIIRIGIVLGLIAYQAFFLYRSFDTKTLSDRIVFPLDYPDLPSEPCDLGDGQVWCAGAEAWTHCWYDPFPCIPRTNDWAEQRGTDLRDGFRSKR